jgi:hypothetical protein
MGYLYPADARSEHFTLQNISTVCALAREYDMPGMMEVAETWMVTAADMLGKPLSSAVLRRLGGMNISPRNGEILERVRLLRLGDMYNLRRFASTSAKQLCKLECRDLRAVMAEYRALGSDEELQNGQYFMHELVAQMIPKFCSD